ncbi:rRNA maturation RNase YbeY [Candidatus Gottesmanbacteria bacterium]|nr:rRNA maturation RNase YbeY [Candidatus Gottesmanbacteria bacterium]
MGMIDILIKAESRFPINRKLIREKTKQVIEQHKVKGDIEVEVLVVGDRKMRTLNRTFRHLDETTDVLSFPLQDAATPGTFVEADEILRLGSVVISYPQAVVLAGSENRMVDEAVGRLLEHGILHLLGIHHE